ncbi:MAG: hypothetical protein U1E35_04295 [Rhodospirillales bacterium]
MKVSAEYRNNIVASAFTSSECGGSLPGARDARRSRADVFAVDDVVLIDDRNPAGAGDLMTNGDEDEPPGATGLDVDILDRREPLGVLANAQGLRKAHRLPAHIRLALSHRRQEAAKSGMAVPSHPSGARSPRSKANAKAAAAGFRSWRRGSVRSSVACIARQRSSAIKSRAVSDLPIHSFSLASSVSMSASPQRPILAAVLANPGRCSQRRRARSNRGAMVSNADRSSGTGDRISASSAQVHPREVVGLPRRVNPPAN